MISVCLPTYCRFDMVMDSIASLYNTCIDKRNFEVIIRFDETDLDSLSRLNELPDETNCRYIVSDHKHGYKSLHDFQNELATHARGGWLMFWNDDVKMISQGWDLRTMNASEWSQPAVIQIETGSQFPTITRMLHNILGHVSLQTSYDDYLNYIGLACEILKNSHCFVDHEYHKGDKGAEDNKASSKYIMDTFHSKATRSLIDLDIRKVKAWLNEHKPKEGVSKFTVGVPQGVVEAQSEQKASN